MSTKRFITCDCQNINNLKIRRKMAEGYHRHSLYDIHTKSWRCLCQMCNTYANSQLNILSDHLGRYLRPVQDACHPIEWGILSPRVNNLNYLFRVYWRPDWYASDEPANLNCCENRCSVVLPAIPFRCQDSPVSMQQSTSGVCCSAKPWHANFVSAELQISWSLVSQIQTIVL